MKVGEVLSKSWGLFKENAGNLIVLFIVYFAVVFFANVVLGFVPLIGWILSTIVSTVMLAGIYYAYLKVLKGEATTVNDMFSSIKEVLGDLAVMAIIKTVFITIGFLLLIIPGIYLVVSYLFAELLVIDKKMDAWEALEESRKRITKNWFSYFALLIVLAVINFLGFIPLGLGLIVTVPLSLMAIVVAYVSEFQEE
jgi:uncharacterized membrane protein